MALPRLIVLQENKIGDFAGCDRAFDVIFPVVAGSVAGHSQQRGVRAHPFLWSQHLTGEGRAGHGGTDGLQHVW